MKTIPFFKWIKDNALIRLLFILAMVNGQWSMANGQINIGGNIYGGGNAGDMSGHTTVTVCAGDINGAVYGGARQANVGGHTFVNIDGEHMSGDILINYVYGGNDISGTIGADIQKTDDIPAELTNAVENNITPATGEENAGKNANKYNAFIHTSKERTVTTVSGESAITTQPYKTYIGQLFGGGNGDYTYTKSNDGKYTAISGNTVIATSTSEFVKPEIDKAYIEMCGGSCVILYGGGNNATVRQATDICIDNPSAITDNIYERNADGTENTSKPKLTDDRLRTMGIYALGGAGENVATSDAYQFSRVFGGNNKAPMDIRPTWHLKKGKIRNLYSGGNRGDMTFEKGIFLAINSDDMEVYNVYGGCRMADVNPDKAVIQQETIEGVLCPPGYAARIHIGGGKINNVYGGNDISGTVYGGNAVGIHSSIEGDVYGGGNGSYPYTDNKDLASSDLYGDFYYDPDEVLSGETDVPTDDDMKSATALTRFRPNAEAVSVRLIGTEAKPTIIGGSVYCGGNSATLRSTSSTATAQLKIGSYVYADNVFLGSNGANMVTEKVLKQIAGTYNDGTTDHDFSQMELTDANQFAAYMKGCEMGVKPEVVFDPDYKKHSTYFGSFYCGGNVGSVNTEGMNTINFNYEVIIYNKLVGGCNNAYVGATAYNAAFDGGLIGDPDDAATGKIGNKLTLNLSGLEIRPMRWKDENDKSKLLEWNVWNVDGEGNKVKDTPPTTIPDDGKNTAADLTRRLEGGNIYGGCYTSGHVNGNVIININATLMDTDKLFDEAEENGLVLYGDDVLEKNSYTILERRTGVFLGEQGMDVLGSSLNVFGGGKGQGTEIWGSTTINLNKGYTFQIFGGSEEGVIGKANGGDDDYAFNGKHYKYDERYGCTVNLCGNQAGVSKTNTENHPDMADCEFIYGGGFLGPICGNTVVNLGNGRIFNSFAGSCNADILGHTETYIGRQPTATGTFTDGFPYVSDYVYGGNDLGGRILNTADFSSRIRHEVTGLTLPGENAAKEVSAYTEYTQGRALGIFGGCYGTYDYTDSYYSTFFTETGTAKEGYTKPRMDNAFVNFRPIYTKALASNTSNKVTKVYGAGQGYPGDADRDIMQERSYILIDIPQEMTNYSAMEVFGAGAWSGLGMRHYVSPVATPNTTQKAALDKVSAIIDLPRGQINAAYGGSYEEGFTRRTVVSVPEKSTIKLNKLFGGAYGLDNKTVCDVYEGNVTWSSVDARVGSIYGGNNNARRTLYGRVSINSPVWTDTSTGYMASVFGAGCGENTWSQYTEVNMNKGSQVYMLYGGGQNGRVCNVETAKRISKEEYGDTYYAGLKIADKYDDGNEYTDDGLQNALAKPRHDGKRYNTNVIINRGAIIGSYVAGYTPGFNVSGGYAYGGGMGSVDKNRSGDVNGTTYIALLGGTVEKDLVAAGSVGSVFDRYGDLKDDFGNDFEASTTAYVAGGVVRNVYGGGYKGSVGKHKTTAPLQKDGADVLDANGDPVMIEVDAALNASTKGDIPAQAYVIIGIREDQTPENLQAAMDYVTSESADNGTTYGFYNGVPAIQRNVYGGGEGETQKGGRGGAVFGRANVILNNGRIGYDYLGGEFVEKLNDETWTVSDSIGRLKDYGSIFGGGYSDKSNVDETNVVIWGGLVRGSVHGGAEVAAIGRGSTRESGDANHVREFEGMYKAGKTHVEMYNGHVLRNVYGGGKGYNVLGFGGANDLYTDGYVFGQTEVYIHGGEIGTAEGVKAGNNYGNVFGGGDLGYVYSKGYSNASTIAGKAADKDTGSPGNYYYYYNDYKCKTAYDDYKVGDVIEACVYDNMSASEKANWENASEPTLIEDCKVVVAPYLQVRSASATIGKSTKQKYEYFDTDDLNTLPKDKSYWVSLFTGDRLSDGSINPDDPDERGVLIHNAVFGGGNVSSNSDTHYANATTVFGNTTATLYDCYHRDFITVGTEHTGGFYGGGNLSKSDGYRELNITSYGTDYYGLSSRITLEEYRNLSNRERAYFQLEYVCKNGTETRVVNGVTLTGVVIDGVFYENGQRVKEEDYEKLKSKEGYSADNWEQFGFCSIYAGRLLNTIQRADLCGVFGSRMVLQGAKDRVAEIGEDIDYTINRVGELSLNKQRSVRNADENTNDAVHGNYFGIYSIVNYLGNLTSDVRFGEVYLNSEGHQMTDTETGNPYTYYSYKKSRPTSNDRNYGTSANQVALASGVFLELTTERTETNANKEKEYGYITGVIELDLINVKRSTEGGGFVYAKNEHRVPRYYPDKTNVLLSKYNMVRVDEGETSRDEARTYKRYRYATPEQETIDGITDHDPQWANENWSAWESTSEVISGDELNVYKTMVFQTSGNFIHPNDKRIIDDCYPTNNAYVIGQDPYSKAHYWYVKGSVYVYKQVLSAYTGSANAYSKDVRLPLTITAASNGRLQLLNVKPNLYAYYFEENKKIGTNGNDGKAWVNNNSDMYQLNDVITWWDWNNLSVSDKKLFVPETVVNSKACKINGNDYEIGEYVMLPSDIATFKTEEGLTITDVEGHPFEDENGHELSLNDVVDDLFRTSNNIGHNSGYVLTFDMNTPTVWDDYYTNENDVDNKIMENVYTDLSNEEKKAYVEGPTYKPERDLVLGQRDYTEGDIVTKAVYDKTETGYGKEKMDVAYVATQTVSYTYNGRNKTANPGTAIPLAEYNNLEATKQACFGKAWVCTNSLKLAEENYLLKGDLLTESEIQTMKNNFASIKDGEGNITGYTDLATEIDAALTEAYICTETGKYGGQKYDTVKNYSAMESWCSLSADDREYFNYNYDALDLFADANYSVETEGGLTTEQAYHSPYSDEVPVEYSAVYTSDVTQTLQFTDGTTRSFTKDTEGATISSNEFESIRNDRRYYTRIETSSTETEAYVATENFIDQGTPYGKGQVVDADVFASNPGKVEKLENLTPNAVTFYCYQNHQEGIDASNAPIIVEKGTRITENYYKNNLIDHQQYFVIRGEEPVETTTLYVSRESDIRDLTKERVITVVYQYTYYENGDNGDIKLTNELHVVNIHLQLESGAPSIGMLDDPPIVLPGSAVGLDRPEVKPGVYEVLINGWEIYADKNDAEYHRNGVEFTNNKTPVYWYQNMDHYIRFYSKTYLGKTYSNYVPVRVANYHDLGEVMERYKDNHLYIDRADVDRPCKIYVNDYTSLAVDDPRSGKNGLDELKNLFDLSVLGNTLDGSPVELDANGLITNEGRFNGHAPLDSHVKGCENLDIYLHTDLDGTVAAGSPERTAIAAGTGEDDPCFGGNLHGDGHTISGLSQSLFGKLCGNVYNLGVTGTFTTAGVADTGDGFVENCWVKSSATSGFAAGTKAVFGNPSRNEGTQVVNCYYPASNAYSESSHPRGNATKMADNDFFNGTVAYNLNGYYLGKRYYDGTKLASGKSYSYLKANVDGTLPTNTDGTQNQATTAYYPEAYAYYTPQNTALTPKLGYVEHRFYDGDFRYANGTIPEGYNIRRQVSDQLDDDDNNIVTWVPIWPDDYLFFGQTLTYGYVEGRNHQQLPAAINKASERLASSNTNNRVYRAPAYFRSKDMQMTHFNPDAVFAQTMNGDDTKIAQKNMTAIDFSGGNGDVTGAASDYRSYGWVTAAPYNHITGGVFCPPLLDDDGITSFQNVDLTKNLLAYTGAPASGTATTASQITAAVVGARLHDYAYAEGNATGTGYVAGKEDYRTVAEWDRNSNYGNMLGHWVQQSGNDYVSTLDHFLVDQHDFNAPMTYTFAADKRMWYQRTPDNYVDRTKGWEAVSLPFTAELVTTDTKGEITHFYSGSDYVDETTKTKVGHEYWLREMAQGGSLSADGTVYTANFAYPTSASTDADKVVTNTFLWDYYYEAQQGHNHKDANQDTYQSYYQMKDVDNDGTDDYVNLFTNYPLLTAAKPYIIGFPGAVYYEFDLSGNFSPANTAGWSKVDKDLKQQVVTFASVPGVSIGVSDDETRNGVTPTGSSYTFKPSYMNETLASVAEGDNTKSKSYALNNDGSAFIAVTRDANAAEGTGNVSVAAFRPYFTSVAGTSPARQTRSIVFSNTQSQLKGIDDEGDANDDNGGITISQGRKKIVVASTRKQPTDIRIVNAAGITIAAFTLQPGESIETRISTIGVYIVQATDGLNKKLVVK